MMTTQCRVREAVINISSTGSFEAAIGTGSNDCGRTPSGRLELAMCYLADVSGSIRRAIGRRQRQSCFDSAADMPSPLEGQWRFKLISHAATSIKRWV